MIGIDVGARVSSPHRYCQNGVRHGARPGGPAFQALIGTAKTQGTPCSSPTIQTVSSPHRYCQNVGASMVSFAIVSCFKPS